MTNQKEIYIVTSGSYSDYCIEKVFTKKEDAEEYCRIMNQSGGWHYEEARVETHSVDDVEIKTRKVIRINAVKPKGKDDYTFIYDVVDMLDSEESSIRRSWLSVADYSYRQETKITLHRPFTGNIEQLVKKSKRIVEDYFFMVEANWDFFVEYANEKTLQAKIEEDMDMVMESLQ